MQTFLPYSDFKQSAKVLDNKRLGKQRVECLQIFKAILDPKYGWQKHPAVLMWKDFHDRLAEYSFAICDELIERGFNDTCRDKIGDLLLKSPQSSMGKTPNWIGLIEFHDSHKSNLLRKNPEHYSQFGWTVPNNLPYIWPHNLHKQTT